MTSNYVCFGKGKPRITRMEDRWGRLERRLETNTYGYVDRVLWDKLQQFQAPICMTDEDSQEYKELLEMLHSVPLEKRDDAVRAALAASSLARRIENTMQLAGRPTTIWEFNAYCDNPDYPQALTQTEFCRFHAFLGDPLLVQWSFLDREIHRFCKWFVQAYNWFVLRYFMKAE